MIIELRRKWHLGRCVDLSDGKLPADWPADVPVIVQAGVDGDAAGCHCRTPEIAQQLVGALRRSAADHAVGFRTVA